MFYLVISILTLVSCKKADSIVITLRGTHQKSNNKLEFRYEYLPTTHSEIYLVNRKIIQPPDSIILFHKYYLLNTKDTTFIGNEINGKIYFLPYFLEIPKTKVIFNFNTIVDSYGTMIFKKPIPNSNISVFVGEDYGEYNKFDPIEFEVENGFFITDIMFDDDLKIKQTSRNIIKAYPLKIAPFEKIVNSKNTECYSILEPAE